MKEVEAGVFEELTALDEGRLDPAQFSHSEHQRFRYELLCHYSFGEALMRMYAKRICPMSSLPNRGFPRLTSDHFTVINPSPIRRSQFCLVV